MLSSQSKAESPHLRAIGLAIAAFTFWLFADTSIKLVGQSSLPAYEVVGFLGLFTALFLALVQGARRQIGLLKPMRLDRQIGRALLDLVNYLGVVVALHHLTLTIFYILVFLAPIVVALLSVIFLGERFSFARALAIVAGFAGVVVAVHPWSGKQESDWIGFLACLICTACFSTNMVWSRVLTQSETPESLAFFSGIVSAVVGFAAMALFHAEPLNVHLTTGLVAMGLFNALGTLCFYTAIKHTSAANVSQYHYTQLIAGTGISYLIWREQPSVFVLIGGVLIVASGVYIAMTAGRA